MRFIRAISYIKLPDSQKTQSDGGQIADFDEHNTLNSPTGVTPTEISAAASAVVAGLVFCPTCVYFKAATFFHAKQSLRHIK